MSDYELELQIQRCLDGELSDSEKQSLFLVLKDDSEAMKLYCLSAAIDASLSRFTDGQISLNSGSESFVELARNYQKQRVSKISMMAAAAAFILMLVTLSLLFVDTTHKSTLAFVASPGTQFIITHASLDERLPEQMVMENGSRLQLSLGSVELTFDSGVKSIITAPADLTLLDGETLQLNEGTAWFQVPQEAIGFTVQTKDLNVVDLGTEFGILADPKKNDEIHVLKGEVQAALRHFGEAVILNAGKARRADPIGQLEIIPVDSTAFLKILPESPPYLHWSFDEAEDGGFKAEGVHPDLEFGFAQPRNAQANSMLVLGRFGKAVHFTGKQGEGLLTEWPGISGDKARTIACWIRISSKALNPGGSSIAAWGKNKYGVPGWHTKWKLAISPDGKPVVVGYDGGIEGNINVADNQWHHIAFTHKMGDSGEPLVSMFIDGRQVENIWKSNKETNSETIGTPNTITTHPESHPLQMGKSLDNSAPIRAELDELYIFEGALDSQTIRRLATENQHQP